MSLRVQPVKQKSSLEISDREDLIQEICCLCNWRARMPNRGRWSNSKININRRRLSSLGWKDKEIPRAQDPGPPDGSWSHGGHVWKKLEPRRRHSLCQHCGPSRGEGVGELALVYALGCFALNDFYCNLAYGCNLYCHLVVVVCKLLYLVLGQGLLSLY